MIYLVYTIHVVTSIFLILVVLLQQGKGADLSVFGGGATQTAFGARGATQIIHKLTVGFFAVFILTTLGIGLLQGHASSSTVMADDPVVEAPAEATASEAAATPADAPAPAAEPAVSEAPAADVAPAEPNEPAPNP